MAGSLFLKPVAFFGTVLGFGEDLGTLFRHQDRVLELGGRTTVFGSNGPAILFIAFGVAGACVDHGLDGEAHSREQPVDATLSIREVGNRRIQVELSPQTVTDVFADNRESSAMSFGGDRFADGGDSAARCQLINRKVHAVEGALRDGSFFLGHFTDQEGFALVPVPAIDDGRDVDVDDIAVFQDRGIGDPVADDFVDANAATFGVLLVPQGGRLVAMIVGPLMDHFVDFEGRDSGLNVGPKEIHQFGVHAAGTPHHVALGVRED